MTRILTIIALLFATPAWANDYLTSREFFSRNKDYQVDALIFGLGEGLSWSQNFYKNKRTQEPLFCPRRQKQFSPSDYYYIGKTYLARDASRGEMPVGILLLRALMEKYPC